MLPNPFNEPSTKDCLLIPTLKASLIAGSAVTLLPKVKFSSPAVLPVLFWVGNEIPRTSI